MIFYRPAGRDHELLPHDPFKSIVAPRPIGWVSTMAADGSVNLAPYSFFNAIGEGPPMLAFSSHGAKDSSTFAGELREFVWNLVTFELREAMNETSAALPRGASEFEHAGLDWEEHVRYDDRYLRPTEVDSLIGDPSKAAELLGWKPQVLAPELAGIMVAADIESVNKSSNPR